MSKTHIATFILHSTSHFLFVLCCKSVTLNNNNKKNGGGGGGGWIVIYNPTKNPIKLEENQFFPNAYTFYKTTSNRYAGRK